MHFSTYKPCTLALQILLHMGFWMKTITSESGRGVYLLFFVEYQHKKISVYILCKLSNRYRNIIITVYGAGGSERII